MRRPIQTLGGAALALALLLAGLASSAAAGPGPGYFASDNVQWVSVNPRHTGSSGGRLHDGYFYVTDPRGVYIYNVADPANPVLTGSLTVAQIGTQTALAQEDPDTNGKILLVDALDPGNAGGGYRLLVIDVTNKAAPRVIGSLGTTDHTWTCVADCTYAYGRTGGIIDLRTPSIPKLAANWKTTVSGSGYTNDFTEVAPGRLMSSGQPSFYLDTTIPSSPTKLTTIKTTFHTLGYHSAVWPRGGQDKFLVRGTELAPSGATEEAGSDCQGDGEIATYDTSAVLAEERAEAENPDGWGPANFAKVDFWEISGRGTYSDGRAPFHTLYCSHWFDTHPEWNDGGLIAAAHYDFGTRFLKVDQAGDITEVGWFQPVGGYTASAYWVTKDIVYVLDYRRGLDILRFTSS
ncbi:MAG: LVIVD repeat-containing protein [Actinomycetota bacterium]